MKDLLLFLLILMLLVQCTPTTPKEPKASPLEIKNYINSEGFVEYSILTIENCQYIILSPGSAVQAMSHKGNCTNPIHNY